MTRWFALIIFIFPTLLLAQTQPFWIENVVGAGFEADIIKIADYNSDGDNDIFFTDYPSNSIKILVNNGDGIFLLHDLYHDLDYLYDIFPIDFDNDGDVDILGIAAPDYYLLWWEYVGNNTFISHILTEPTPYSYAKKVYSCDLDLDNDNDIILSTINGIYYYINNGSYEFTEYHLVQTDYEAEDYDIGDINNDGYMDIVCSYLSFEKVTWWENNGDNSFTNHTVQDNIYCNQTVLSDINNDSYIDIVSIVTTIPIIGNRLAWWENNGNDSFILHIITDYDAIGQYISCSDIDYDSNIDIISSQCPGHDLAWWENVNSYDDVWNKHIIDGYTSQRLIYSANLDQDDLVELISNSSQGLLYYDQSITPHKVTPLNTIIGPDGGYISYSLIISNSRPVTYDDVNFWNEVLLPNGEIIGALNLETCTIHRYQTVSYNEIRQYIPNYAPDGVYLYSCILGYYPDVAFAIDFSFTKSADLRSQEPSEVPSLGEYYVEDWRNEAWETTDAQVTNLEPLPTEFSVSPAYPNPFNASASLTVSLPEPAELTVTVYDVLGRQVAVLANGQHSAGDHRLTFDANHLASGVYFVHAVVPGHIDQVQKVMLVS